MPLYYHNYNKYIYRREAHIMAHEIMDNRLAVRTPAWHKLGTVFGDQKLNATQAMEMADMLFEVKKYPQYFKKEDGTELTTNSYAVVREPTSTDNNHELLATVGEQWTPIQARALGELLDPIAKNFPVESAGALGKGEKIFLSLDASESKIAGEDHHLYWLVTDSRDGTGGLKIALTPYRVVCQNTLILGLKSAKVSVSLKHGKSIAKDTAFYTDIFSNMAEIKKQVITTMNSLTNHGNQLEKSEVDKIINYAYPNASRPSNLKLSDGIKKGDVFAPQWDKILAYNEPEIEKYAKRQKRREAIREDARERLDIFNQEFGHLANTPWAVYNAIVESEDKRPGHDGKNSAVASSTGVFGERAKTKSRAFSKALDALNYAKG